MTQPTEPHPTSAVDSLVQEWINATTIRALAERIALLLGDMEQDTAARSEARALGRVLEVLGLSIQRVSERGGKLT